MSKRKIIINRDELRSLDIKFCTTCEEALDNWALSPKSFDIDAVKANHENCKRIGRFKGEMCARLFISMNGKSEELLFPDEED